MKKYIGGLKGRAVKSCIIGLAIAAGLFVFGKAVFWVSVYGFRTKAQVMKDARELSEVIEKYVEEQEKYREEVSGAAALQAEAYASAAAVFEENHPERDAVAAGDKSPEQENAEPSASPKEGEASILPKEEKKPIPPEEFSELEADKPPAEKPDIETNEPTPEAPAETELRQADYAKLVFDSAKYYEEGGKVVFTYSQPEIPEKYHLSVEIAIFNAEGGTIDRYCSDWGWRSDMKYYDPSAKDVKVKLAAATLKNKQVIMTVMVGNSRMNADTSVYKLTEDINGNKELKTANLKGGD